MKDESMENSLIYQYNNGWSVRRLSEEYHCSRRRVRRILQEHERVRAQGVSNKPDAVVRKSKLDPYKDYIHKLIEILIFTLKNNKPGGLKIQ